jgi:hypothetical protein
LRSSTGSTRTLTDVQSVFVNDSDIELRLGIASFGGFK